MPCVPLQSLTAFFKFFLMLERCSGTRYIADPRPAGWTEQTISFPSQVQGARAGLQLEVVLTCAFSTMPAFGG